LESAKDEDEFRKYMNWKSLTGSLLLKKIINWKLKEV
jgi:hypothetical protein